MMKKGKVKVKKRDNMICNFFFNLKNDDIVILNTIFLIEI